METDFCRDYVLLFCFKKSSFPLFKVWEIQLEYATGKKECVRVWTCVCVLNPRFVSKKRKHLFALGA